MHWKTETQSTGIKFLSPLKVIFFFHEDYVKTNSVWYTIVRSIFLSLLTRIFETHKHSTHSGSGLESSGRNVSAELVVVVYFYSFYECRVILLYKADINTRCAERKEYIMKKYMSCETENHHDSNHCWIHRYQRSQLCVYFFLNISKFSPIFRQPTTAILNNMDKQKPIVLYLVLWE